MPDRERRAYVMAAHYPSGGGLCLHRVGQILHQHFGWSCVAVGEAPGAMFDYPVSFPWIPAAALDDEIRPDDLFIGAPAFSPALYGLRLRCKKLMYAMSTYTYQVLDGFFDRYVSQSRLVAGHLHRVYGIESPIIPGFVDLSVDVPTVPWHERPADVALVVGKVYIDALFAAFQEKLAARFPDLRVRFVRAEHLLRGGGASHHDFRALLGGYRYILALSPLEGFGLIPLEAMAAGCTVVGFHAGGGEDYMRPGQNCDVSRYPLLDDAVTRFAAVLTDETYAVRLAQNAVATARVYDYCRFEKDWRAYFAAHAGWLGPSR